MREELGLDVTVLTIAHRLQSIMDSDKIVSDLQSQGSTSGCRLTIILQMVLDAGRLVEFDSPEVLLQNEDSLLRALVEESADKDTLYATVKGKKAA